MIIIEIIKTIFLGIKLGIEAFLTVLPIYDSLANLPVEIFSIISGIPEWIITIITNII